MQYMASLYMLWFIAFHEIDRPRRTGANKKSRESGVITSFRPIDFVRHLDDTI